MDNLKKIISIFIPCVGIIAGALYFWESIFSNAGMTVYSEPDFYVPPFAAVVAGGVHALYFTFISLIINFGFIILIAVISCLIIKWTADKYHLPAVVLNWFKSEIKNNIIWIIIAVFVLISFLVYYSGFKGRECVRKSIDKYYSEKVLTGCALPISFQKIKYKDEGSGNTISIAGFVVTTTDKYLTIHAQETVYHIPHSSIISIIEEEKKPSKKTGYKSVGKKDKGSDPE